MGVLSQAYFHYHKYKEVGFKIQINPEVYPLYAMNFLEANKIDGNILVFFDWGEYVINKRPASKVSIDGRLWTAYPDEVFVITSYSIHYTKLYEYCQKTSTFLSNCVKSWR